MAEDVPQGGGWLFGIDPTLLEQVPRSKESDLLRINNSRLIDVHYAALGRVAAAWSSFEALIDGATASMAHLDAQVATCLTAQMMGGAQN